MIDYNYGVSLRRLSKEDLPLIFMWRNHPDIYKWCRQSSPLHWGNHLEWFENQSKDLSLSMFMIEDGQPLGVCGLTSIDLVNSRAEFSCYIDPKLQGMGYAKKALKTLFVYGFTGLGLNRIWGETFDKNPAIELFFKLGMETEGTRKEFYYRDGHFIDAHLVSVSRDKFFDLLSSGSGDKSDPGQKDIPKEIAAIG